MTGRTLRWLLSLGHRSPGGAESPRLVIIRHHRVFEDGERPLYRLGVTREVFAAQLDLLGRLGLTPITVSEGVRRLETGESGRWVAMSFDDGYADNVTAALPELATRGARATFYLTAGLIEDRRAPWWDTLGHMLDTSAHEMLRWPVDEQTLELPLGDRAARARALERVVPLLRVPPPEQERRLASLADALGVMAPAPCELATWGQARALVEAGMEVGSHTLSHPFLSLLDPAEQRREIVGSVERIEQRLGTRPQGIAYPGGDYDRATLVVVTEAGLTHAVTTRTGDNGAQASRLELKRRGLSEGACLGPGGRFSRRLAMAELDGAFDRLRAPRLGEVAA